MTRPPIIFLHLPKASGTSFRYIIDREYGADNVLSIPVYGEPVDRFLEGLDASQRSQYGAVVGHAPFGIARFFGPEFQYVTIVRDPVERTISRYYHILRRGESMPAYKDIVERKLSVVEFALGDFDQQLDNGQTRLLAGNDYRAQRIPVKHVDRTHLEEALENLDRIAVVGTTDGFDRTLVLLRRKFGWRVPLYVKENTTKRPPGAQLTETERAAIREHNALDDELYRRASSRLLRDCRAAGPAFEIELRAFQALNAAAVRARSVVRAVRSMRDASR